MTNWPGTRVRTIPVESRRSSAWPAASRSDMSLSEADREWLLRASSLAGRGWGRVHPNPMVGCVLTRDGELVGEGWHEESAVRTQR